MANAPSDDLHRWARAWVIAGEYLDDERRERLRSMSDDEARSIIARIFSEPLPPRVERRTGLIEQQRLFRQLK